MPQTALHWIPIELFAFQTAFTDLPSHLLKDGWMNGRKK
jgi:hypothetical protein